MSETYNYNNDDFISSNQNTAKKAVKYFKINTPNSGLFKEKFSINNKDEARSSIKGLFASISILGYSSYDDGKKNIISYNINLELFNPVEDIFYRFQLDIRNWINQNFLFRVLNLKPNQICEIIAYNDKEGKPNLSLKTKVSEDTWDYVNPFFVSGQYPENPNIQVENLETGELEEKKLNLVRADWMLYTISSFTFNLGLLKRIDRDVNNNSLQVNEIKTIEEFNNLIKDKASKRFEEFKEKYFKDLLYDFSKNYDLETLKYLIKEYSIFKKKDYKELENFFSDKFKFDNLNLFGNKEIKESILILENKISDLK